MKNVKCKNANIMSFSYFQAKVSSCPLSLVTPFGVLIGLAVTAQISEVIFLFHFHNKGSHVIAKQLISFRRQEDSTCWLLVYCKALQLGLSCTLPFMR